VPRWTRLILWGVGPVTLRGAVVVGEDSDAASKDDEDEDETQPDDREEGPGAHAEAAGVVPAVRVSEGRLHRSGV
jgi:hypothetical protein